MKHFMKIKSKFFVVLMLFAASATMWAADVTLSGSDDYTAQDGDVLSGSTSGTVTIASGASITLSGVTITGGIVCTGTATITLAGANSVTGAQRMAGIQIGGSGTTLTIKGDGSLTATGESGSAGIGLSRAWAVDAYGGDIVIESGNITAIGSSIYGAAGIGTGVIYGKKTAEIGNITIKGGTVKAIGGKDGNGIGTGHTYVSCTNTIGTITIYDDIDMVDASSITDFASVVYMHGGTDVTSSKTDYFTIGGIGDRRIIVQPDDNDYTITIAGGIEHGTLTVAATAKYVDAVTVTATPAYGYHLDHLIVKDSQNNDITVENKTFIMPQSNVTISAVFAKGFHGTTEFELMYFGIYSEEREAYIYEGMTTVNLQTYDSSYYIQNDDSNKFLLDNSTTKYLEIPFSGGTGSFIKSNTSADYDYFHLPENGKTGFYDFTLTDMSSGKWYLSIKKTEVVIADIPDQTYTGSAISPEPSVAAGALDLTKGTDYEYSYTNNTNAGTATVTITFKDDYAALGSVEKKFTILPVTTTVTANADPNSTGTYYATFYNSTKTYIADCEVYYVTANTDGKFTLAKADGNIIKAGAGVILKSNSASIVLTETIHDTNYNSLLTGTDSTTTVTNALVLSLGIDGVRFYKYSGEIGANKAYLEQ